MKPELYMRVVDYTVAWLNVSADVNAQIGMPNHSRKVRPLLTERAPFSAEQALLMFDILQRQSDSLWAHTMRMVPKRATPRNYRRLLALCAIRRNHLMLQTAYLARGYSLTVRQQSGSADLRRQLGLRSVALTPKLKEASELKKLLKGELSGKEDARI